MWQKQNCCGWHGNKIVKGQRPDGNLVLIFLQHSVTGWDFFFNSLLQNNIQQIFRRLHALLVEEYSGEDLQIIACPSTEQVQLTGNWHILRTLNNLKWALVRHRQNWSSLCASYRLTSCCLSISNVPVLTCGDAGERSARTQEPCRWDGFFGTGASEDAGPRATRTIRHPAHVQGFSSDSVLVHLSSVIDRDPGSLFICFLPRFYFMQIKTGVVVGGALMCEILCCFTGADSRSRLHLSLTSICTGCEGVGVKYIRSVQT